MTFACVSGLCLLTFGLGMSNNGTGQVLASVALASRPLVLLPIIVYNLSQHIVAGFVHTRLAAAAQSTSGGER